MGVGGEGVFGLFVDGDVRAAGGASAAGARGESAVAAEVEDCVSGEGGCEDEKETEFVEWKVSLGFLRLVIETPP